MKLSEYLTAKRGRQSDLAKAIGAHIPDVCRWAYGIRSVPFHFAPKIEAATLGEVSRKDLFPNDWHKLWPELKESTPM